MDIVIAIIVFILGLLFGSFTNVIIYRMPREESIVQPPSHCPSCNTRLGVLDLIPVLSWVFLRGRCRYCQERISPRYAVVELLSGLLFLVVYLRYGFTMATVAGWVFVVILLAVSFTDLDEGMIPDRLTYPGMVLGLVLSFWTIGFLPALYGFLAFGGLMLAIAVISNGGMGGGDIKLAACIGAFTGLIGSAITLMMAALLGAVFGLGLIFLKRGGRKTMVKFGPFLAVSAFTAYLYAANIWSWYTGSFF